MAETGRGDENGKDSKDQKRGWVEKLRRLIRPAVYLSHNWISRIGVVLATTSAITLVLAYISQPLGYVFNPYIGLIIFMILLPAFPPGQFQPLIAGPGLTLSGPNRRAESIWRRAPGRPQE